MEKANEPRVGTRKYLPPTLNIKVKDRYLTKILK